VTITKSAGSGGSPALGVGPFSLAARDAVDHGFITVWEMSLD
jgi:hypothetical protein